MRSLAIFSLFMCTTPIFAQVSPFGACAHLGGGEEFNDRLAQFQLMKDAGIHWARADFTWSYFEEQEGQWKFDNYDAIVRDSKQYDVTLLPILCYNVDWAFPAHENLDKWCNFVRMIVTRYQNDLPYWEVWNEPNIGFWRPEPNAKQYAELLIATYKTIKEVNPKLQVMYGGTAGIPFEYIRETLEAGAANSFDVMAVHPYRYPTTPETGKLYEDLIKTRDLMDEFNRQDAPIWITEMGWPTHINPVMAEDGNFLAGIITKGTMERFPEKESFKAIALTHPGSGGSDSVAAQLKEALERQGNWEVNIDSALKLDVLDTAITDVVFLPQGENYPSDQFDILVDFVREGGLLVQMGGVPLYYSQQEDAEGWKNPLAGEGARETLHVGWKAWWTETGLPEEAGETRLAFDDPNIKVPQFTKSTRWLTDAKIKGNDRFVPLLEAYQNDTLIGYPAAVYLFDSELKGGFMSIILGVVGSGVTDDVEAIILPRAYLVSLAAGVECYLWYEFRDGGDDASYNEHRFGIIRHDLTPKPAWDAYQVMTNALGDAKFIKRISTADEKVWACLFDAGESQTLAIWRDGEPVDLTVKLEGNPKACDHLGRVIPLEVKNGAALLSVSQSVTYITGLTDAQIP